MSWGESVSRRGAVWIQDEGRKGPEMFRVGWRGGGRAGALGRGRGMTWAAVGGNVGVQPQLIQGIRRRDGIGEGQETTA